MNKPKPHNKMYCDTNCPFLTIDACATCSFGCEGKSYSTILETDGIYPTTHLIYRSEECREKANEN